MSELTSEELFRRVRDGEDGAADEVFRRYVTRLVGLARQRMSSSLSRRVDPEDVVQSAFRSFFVHSQQADYILRRSGDLWRLLASITLNKVYGHADFHTAQRRDMKREAASDTCSDAIAGVEPGPAESAALMEQLNVAMNGLTEMERTVLERRLAGDTIECIAQAIQRSHRTVRRCLENARLHLEQQLGVG